MPKSIQTRCRDSVKTKLNIHIPVYPHPYIFFTSLIPRPHHPKEWPDVFVDVC